eukprot:PhM_4_TR7461/c1_g1_i1/m.13593
MSRRHSTSATPGGGDGRKDAVREEMRLQQQRWMNQIGSGNGGVAPPPGPSQSSTPPGYTRTQSNQNMTQYQPPPVRGGVTITCAQCGVVFNGASDVVPMLLVPCGHTLCSPCTQRLVSVTPPEASSSRTRRSGSGAPQQQYQQPHGGGRCPVCRGDVLSVAINQALHSMLGAQQQQQSYGAGGSSGGMMGGSMSGYETVQQSQQFSGSFGGGGGGGGGTSDAALPLSILQLVKTAPQAEQYARKYFSALRRWRVVAEEHYMAKAEVEEWSKNIRTHERVVANLSSELRELNDRVAALQQECAIVSQQLKEEQDQQRTIEDQLSLGHNRVHTLSSTVEQVENEMGRARLILTELCPQITPEMLQ